MCEHFHVEYRCSLFRNDSESIKRKSASAHYPQEQSQKHATCPSYGDKRHNPPTQRRVDLLFSFGFRIDCPFGICGRHAQTMLEWQLYLLSLSKTNAIVQPTNNRRPNPYSQSNALPAKIPPIFSFGPMDTPTTPTLNHPPPPNHHHVRERERSTVFIPMAVVTPHSRISGRKQRHGSPFWRQRRRRFIESIIRRTGSEQRWYHLR